MRLRGSLRPWCPLTCPQALLLLTIACVCAVGAAGDVAVPGSPTLSQAPSLSATLKRLKCIGHTQPLFDPARCSDGWDCKLYLPKAKELETDGHECTCCMGCVRVGGGGGSVPRLGVLLCCRRC